MDHLRLEQTIGSGTFGKVKRALHLPTAQQIAVKILNKNKIASKKDAIRIQREIAILKKVDHPNLLKLLQLIETPKSFMLVTCLVEGQELYQLINRRGGMEEEQAGGLFAQLFDAVLHLKTKGIAHRDIKPQNIIVAGDKLTLIDFGLGKMYQEGQKLSTSCGSPCYAAPQMMTAKTYDPEKTQVWALGVTLYAMLSGRLPFQHDSGTQLLKLMTENNYEELPHISLALRELLRGMIEAKPAKRLTLQDIKRHRWIQALQYEFTREDKSKNWDQKLLLKMEKQFGLKRPELLQRILFGFGCQSIMYQLWAGKDESRSPFPFHRGPIHLKHVFPTLQSAQQWISKHLQKCRWVGESRAEGDNLCIQLRQLQGNLLYVHVLPPS